MFGELRARVLLFVSRRLLGRLDVDALVGLGMEVGEDVFIDRETWFDTNFCWLISIGDRCTMAPGVRILTHDASTKGALGYTRLAPVRIGADTFIGAGSLILPGATIGDGAIVGAGSVVRRDVPPRTLVTGNPAEPVGDVQPYLDRQAERLEAAEPYGGPGYEPTEGLASDTNRRIRAEALERGYVFVE